MVWIFAGLQTVFTLRSPKARMKTARVEELIKITTVSIALFS
jgi:hypothetical protein